jgi:amino acid transporter
MWYQSTIAIAYEITAAAVLIRLWDDETSPAAWMSIIIVVIVGLNVFAVSIYGEAEFIFAAIKIVTIIGLLIMALILDLGGSPTGDRLGFRYWYNPGPAMKEVIAGGNTGRFLGLFSTLVFAAFSYGGIEMVAVAAGETVNPCKNIPKAVKRLFWRILIFYVLGSLAIGVLVPSNNKGLGSVSPWVIAIQHANIRVLPSILNAVILTSASSSANAFLFVGSRYLFGLAQNKQAPRIFLKCTKRGIPIYGVGFTALWTGLAYMSVSAGAQTVFLWFLNIGTIASLFTWCSILVAYLRFRQALMLQGVNRNDLHFKSPFQPYTAWFALCYFALIIVFNGWEVFTKGNWSVEGFITAYVGIPIYFGLYVFWKMLKRTSLVDPAEADIWSGKAALDAKIWPDTKPRNFLEKVWQWIV